MQELKLRERKKFAEIGEGKKDQVTSTGNECLGGLRNGPWLKSWHFLST